MHLTLKQKHDAHGDQQADDIVALLRAVGAAAAEATPELLGVGVPRLLGHLGCASSSSVPLSGRFGMGNSTGHHDEILPVEIVLIMVVTQ